MCRGIDIKEKVINRGIDIKEKVIKKPLDEWLLLPLKLSAHGM